MNSPPGLLGNWKSCAQIASSMGSIATSLEALTQARLAMAPARPIWRMQLRSRQSLVEAFGNDGYTSTSRPPHFARVRKGR